MSRELISKKTRYEFQEHFVGNVLREIEAEFDAADVPFDAQHVPRVSGARRSLVQQYYHAVDWTRWDDVRKVLVLYQNVLAELEEGSRATSGWDTLSRTTRLTPYALQHSRRPGSARIGWGARRLPAAGRQFASRELIRRSKSASSRPPSWRSTSLPSLAMNTLVGVASMP